MATQISERTSDYAAAERFLPWNAEELVYRMLVEPNWLEDDAFWYSVRTRAGTEHVLVEPRKGARRTASEAERTTKPSDPAGEVRSPDGKWLAFARDNNLLVRDARSGEEFELTFDGDADSPYATPLPSPLESAGIETRDPSPKTPALWSPDSRRFVSFRIHARGAGQYHLVQSTPLNGSARPVLHSYAYPLPGDEEVPTAELFIFDVADRTSRRVDIAPVPILYYGGPIRDGWSWWEISGDRFYLLSRSRGCQSLALVAVDGATGAARSLLEEYSETGIDPHLTSAGKPNVRTFDNGSRVLWFSQRDGWGHLYVYDATTGELLEQLTSGALAVADVLHMDEVGRWVYFTAVGTAAASDPYFELLYRVSLDGGEPQLLTPEDATHRITFSPSGDFFIDSYSRVDQPPVTVLRSATGDVLIELERADIEDLVATGWTCPERFCVKARDGSTDIYGVLIRPTSFNGNSQLPVLDDIYAGPQTNRAPASFAGYTSPSHQHPSHAARGFWHAQALAELGFAVVMVDGLGMPFRSKAFRDWSFRNVGDGGIEDHVVALRQLALQHPYLDLERVGVYGHSAGGYASTHAMLRFPEFFKVAVSSAGNHDHRLDKATWIERYMGLPVGDYYCEQANSTLADNLRGKLLLIHGEMDENVHVASTLQLVDALIKADKDFDLLLLPNRPHACTDDLYFIRRRWDYFVRHLLGREPPAYVITRDS
ncbi:MAG: DPP IV N-terminal domain-containing protein [Chloroflexi bacterium]|nr:DPP IV N-terminal domain-containing protein [Chloroflexota bacterium]